MKLLPFFTYYGGKFRVAHRYPRPVTDRIIEPFAGSAGYALNYSDRDVRLVDLDENITQTWQYLIAAPESEIAALPDLRDGESVDDLDVPAEARLLIGWWLNKGSASPKRRPSTFMLKHPEGGPYWGSRVRERIAKQQRHIRHWKISHGSYDSLDNPRATWFIDPPYQKAGKHYRFGSGGIDYASLADWCKSRSGQVIVCEMDEASWLPFQPLAAIDGTEGRQKINRARLETVWSMTDQVDEIVGGRR